MSHFLVASHLTADAIPPLPPSNGPWISFRRSPLSNQGEKMLRGVLIERSVQIVSTSLKQVIASAHMQSMPICIPIPDYKVQVRTLDCVEELSFRGTMSPTHITIDRATVVLLHAMRNLISHSRVCEGLQDVLQANAFARTLVQQGLLCIAYAPILPADRLVAHGGGFPASKATAQASCPPDACSCS